MPQLGLQQPSSSLPGQDDAMRMASAAGEGKTMRCESKARQTHAFHEDAR